jgi:hypothetical protein
VAKGCLLNSMWFIEFSIGRKSNLGPRLADASHWPIKNATRPITTDFVTFRRFFIRDYIYI